MTRQQKIDMLTQAVRESVPELKESDAGKRTPTGQKFAQIAETIARKLYVQTGDHEWMKIAKKIIPPNIKPAAPDFMVK